MLWLLLGLSLFISSEELDGITILDDYLEDEFSERVQLSPVIEHKPDKINITSDRFEHLFRPISSVQVRSEGSPSTSIRGSQQAARVLFLLNEVPLNFADGFGGSSQFIPTEIIDQINIFEGPTSASYGAPAMSGAIHFLTGIRKRPQLRLGLADNDESPIKDFSTSTRTVSYVQPLLITETDQLQASAFYQLDRGNFPFHDASGTKFVRNNNTGHNRRFTLYGQHQRDKWRWSELLLFSHLNRFTPGSLNFPSVTQQRTDAGLAAISAKKTVGSSSLWSSRASYSYLDSQATISFPSESDSQQLWLSQGFITEVRPQMLSKTFLDWSYNSFKATYANNERFTFGAGEFNQSLLIPLTESISVEPQYKYLFRFRESLFAVHSKYKKDNYESWLMISQGYRPPSLIDLHSNSNFGFVGNPDLEPEQSIQYEVGGKISGRYGRLSLSFFHNDFDDIVQRQNLGGGLSTKINTGKATINGLTAKTVVPLHPFEFEFAYTALDTKDEETGERLLFSPKHQFFSRLSHQYKWLRTTLQQSWWSEVLDRDFSNNTVELTQWRSTDILFDISMSSDWSLSLATYNIFNQRRELNLNYPEPQRRYAMTFEYNF